MKLILITMLFFISTLASAQQWEYKLVRYFGFDSHDVTPEMNKLGKERWELITIFTKTKGMWYLVYKRPVKAEK